MVQFPSGHLAEVSRTDLKPIPFIGSAMFAGAIASDDQVRVTPSIRSQKGSIQPFDFVLLQLEETLICAFRMDLDEEPNDGRSLATGCQTACHWSRSNRCRRNGTSENDETAIGHGIRMLIQTSRRVCAPFAHDESKTIERNEPRLRARLRSRFLLCVLQSQMMLCASSCLALGYLVHRQSRSRRERVRLQRSMERIGHLSRFIRQRRIGKSFASACSFEPIGCECVNMNVQWFSNPLHFGHTNEKDDCLGNVVVTYSNRIGSFVEKFKGRMFEPTCTKPCHYWAESLVWKQTMICVS